MPIKPAAVDTKTKIIDAAFELFGKYGFEGTSVREISRRSGVNLAAINYHFKNKENLFWEIMSRTYLELDQKIAQMADESKDTVELALKTFDHFQTEKSALKNTMKMILDEGIAPPDSNEVQEALESPMGPPGGQYFAEVIQRDIPYQLSYEGVLWGVKSIFGSVFHWGIMLCSDKACASSQTDELMSPKQIRKDVERMTVASLMFLKHNQKEFKDRGSLKEKVRQR